MHVDTAKALGEETQTKIAILVQDFQRQSGLTVDDVHINQFPQRMIGKVDEPVVQVFLDVRLR